MASHGGYDESYEMVSASRQNGVQRARAARPPRIVLTNRRRAIFRTLGVHQLLSSEQLRRVHFPWSDPRRARREFSLLCDVSMLARLPVVSERSSVLPAFWYSLTPHSLEIVSEELGRPVPLASVGESGRSGAGHLAICDLYVALTEAVRGSAWSVRQWQHVWELKRNTAFGWVVDGCRSSDGDVVAPKEQKLAAVDAYFTLSDDRHRQHYLVAYDDANDDVLVWRERARRLAAVVRHQDFWQRCGSETPRVVVVHLSGDHAERRACAIQQVIRDATDAHGLFLVERPDGAAALLSAAANAP